MSDSSDFQTDTLSNQDLEGISGAVEKGILRAAKAQERAQNRRSRVIGAGYTLAAMTFVALFILGWIQRPAQTVVLNARFLTDAKLTAVLPQPELPSSQQVSFLLRLDGVENISQLQDLPLRVDLVLPLDGDEFQEPPGDIERLEFATSGRNGAENGNGAAPVSVLVSASKVQQVTLSRPSQRGQGVTRVDVRTVADQIDQAKVTIEVIPELDRKVTITADNGTTSALLGMESVTLELESQVDARPVSGDQLMSSSFETDSGSESPGMRFDARVSRLSLSGTEGFFDVGQTRVPLVSDDTLELTLLEERSFGVEIIDGKISLGSAAVATSVKRGETQLLRRRVEASPIYRTFVTALGAALLGLFSSVLPALATLIGSLSRYTRFGDGD